LSFSFSCSMCSNSCSWCCFRVCSVRTLKTYKLPVSGLLFVFNHFWFTVW
jgi:hypothetical protein